MSETQSTYIMNTYQTDFYSWTQEQVELIKTGNFAALDCVNLIDEIEELAANKREALKSHFRVLLMHLLKWQYQPGKNFGNSWRVTIEIQRIEIVDLLVENPGLKPEIQKLIYKAYRIARLHAEKETGISRKTFPTDCPWTFEQMIDADFFPE